MAVDQRVGTTVPRPFLTLDEAKYVDEQRHVANVMDNMLKRPPLQGSSFIDEAAWIVGHQTRLVRLTSPWLLVVHNVRDFIIVWSPTAMFYVIAPRWQGLHLVVRKD
ncbi:MAG: hypothetical protein OXG37_16180 [Actinomycetia bacterium]|nr:hypothetical protein [Actinomycetes bacterium]